MQKLLTAAGEALSGTPWNVYPRPHLVRRDWLCLNGPWQFSCAGQQGTVQVPFCPESLLSGFQGTMVYGKEMVYRRAFTLPDEWRGRRVLLHFGAVSRKAEVLVNGQFAVRHEEGYFPFSADITALLRPGENEITVRAVQDLSPRHPWGKQRKKRGGMWYTPVSGIWQTVWLEPVPESYIQSLSIRTGENWADITVQGVREGTLTLQGQDYPLQNGKARVEFSSPILWSPENPHLYRFTLHCGEDTAASYFALRTLSIQRFQGLPRLCLNGRPYFFHALLDQGYWSDGLYTPAAPECYAQDIAAMKALGFNTLRKHIKIEPEQFYYDCDRLGMIVFQDMVNNGRYRYIRDTVLPTLGFQKKKDRRLHADPRSRQAFLSAMETTVKLLDHHPSVCLWTIFNEGWGQFRADDAYRRLRALDASRFIDAASGWFAQGESDVESLHIYFKPLTTGSQDRPQLLSEFGGWSLKYPEHSFNTEKTYGYRKYDDPAAFLRDLRSLYLNQVLPLIEKGLCGAVYTQLSDVEDETNGLLTFDRRIAKIAPEDFRDVSARLTAPLDTNPSVSLR